MSIWEYQRLIIRRLLQWSLISLVTGAVLSRGLGLRLFGLRPNRFWRGVGGQFVGWALVNVGIAYFGAQGMEKRQQALPDPAESSVVAKEVRSLRKLLWINTALDLLYVRFGRWLIGRGNRGTGVGVALQGLFLFLFDLYHAASIPDTDDNAPV